MRWSWIHAEPILYGASWPDDLLLASRVSPRPHRCTLPVETDWSPNESLHLLLQPLGSPTVSLAHLQLAICYPLAASDKRSDLVSVGYRSPARTAIRQVTGGHPSLGGHQPARPARPVDHSLPAPMRITSSEGVTVARLRSAATATAKAIAIAPATHPATARRLDPALVRPPAWMPAENLKTPHAHRLARDALLPPFLPSL